MNKKENSKKKKGFTLVEILVVIIVISVLSSIAVVQYQKSVLKSQFATLLPIAKALHESEELFAMSRGNYTDRLENLDASAGANGSTANINGSIVSLGVNNRHAYVKATKENFDNNLIMFQKGSFYFPGEIHCEAKEDKTLANWLCQKELGGTKLERSLTEGYNDYVIQGDGNGFFPKDFTNISGTSTNKKELSDGDICTAAKSSDCNFLNLNNGATCYGKYTNNCYNSDFTDSNCIAAEVYSCNNSSFVNSQCVGNRGHTCKNSTYTNSVCEGNIGQNCYDSDFINSTCIGNDKYDCGKWDKNPTFIDSKCVGNADLSCGLGIYSGISTCEGWDKTACGGGVFKDNSICYAYVQGSCGIYNDYAGTKKDTTYEGNACCKGDFCPGNAPKCDCGIDANTGQHALSC